MPRRADEWSRDNHPPYCTCATCTQRRLSRVQAGHQRHPRTRRPSRARRRRPRRQRRSGFRLSISRLLFTVILLAGAAYGGLLWFGLAELPEVELPEIELPEYDPTNRYPGDAPLNSAEIATWVVHYTNEERRKVGLRELVRDPAIDAIAMMHSENMIEHGVFHKLLGKDPTDRAFDAGYTCRAYRFDGSYTYGLSENIFSFPRVTSKWDSGRPAEFVGDSQEMALGLVKGWMTSPGHRENIMDPFIRRIGIGIAVHEAPEGTWVHEEVFATQNFSECL